MYIRLNNIGKIISASIDLNGITVIAGENDTGKSTISKTLYAICDSLSHLNSTIYNSHYNSIYKIIDYNSKNFKQFSIDKKTIATELLSYSGQVDLKYVQSLVIKYSKPNKTFRSINNETMITENEFYNKFSKQIYNSYSTIMSISNEQHFINEFNKRIKTEFNSQINNVGPSPVLNGTIEFESESLYTILHLYNDKIKTVSGIDSLKTNVLYIDDPFLLDQAAAIKKYKEYNITGSVHRDDLLRKLLSNNKISDKEHINQRMKLLMCKIEDICGGTSSFDQKSGFSYKPGERRVPFTMSNVSTGLKTFIIIKKLIDNGELKDNDILILDEPEVHLHPEWQILFAEIIILLYQEFNLHILINTHSPYFLEGIEVYSQKYKVTNKCKYYLTKEHVKEQKKIGSYVIDVTNSIDEIYKKLAIPFQKLEDEEYNND